MEPTPTLRMARRNDPQTSKDASKGASQRSLSQKIQLLLAYADNPNGLTDEEAGVITGLFNLPKCSYWKRCSELETEGFIARTLLTRQGMTGNHMMVRQITPNGLTEAKRWMR